MKKFFNFTFLSLSLFSFLFTPVLPAAAQGLSDQAMGLQYGAATGLSATDPRIVAAKIIRVALGLLGTVAVGIVLYSGFLWMTAGGNDEKIGQAKGWLAASVIGLAIILSAFAIATFVVSSLTEATSYATLPKIF